MSTHLIAVKQTSSQQARLDARVLLINPPLSEAAGPYPAICYLAGYLDTLGVTTVLADASLALLLRIFCRAGLDELRLAITDEMAAKSRSLRIFLGRFEHYADTIDTAIAALQGRDIGALTRAAKADYFPPPLNGAEYWATLAYLRVQSHARLLGPLTLEQRERLQHADPLVHAFGTLGRSDAARYRATQLLVDLAVVIQQSIAPDFALNAYSERVSRGAPTFEPVQRALDAPPGLLDRYVNEIATDVWSRHRPDIVGLSVPFAGNVLGALRIAKRLKELQPGLPIALGGGWVNNKLRQLSDPGVFDYVDFVTLDEGEWPLRAIIESRLEQRDAGSLVRTFIRRDGRVEWIDAGDGCNVPSNQAGVPTYRGLPLEQYLSLQMSLQRRHTLWSRRWNKLTLAKGCYWKKCTFCDTSLDYIGRYEPDTIDNIVHRIRTLKLETGESGFHFVDEAMPPALMKRLAERLISEKLDVTWWGNVRFDAALAPMAPLLVRSGCHALTGGIEVASNRLLALIEKGVTVEQVIRVAHAYASRGVMVHAYLIYGFPSQTAQETIDALEYLRQMFEADCLHSVAWHRFMLTAFSPVAAQPDRFGVRIQARPPNPFANYLLDYDEPGAIDHDRFRPGLSRAVGMYMNGVGFDRPVTDWFDFEVPATTVPPDFVRIVIGSSSSSGL